MNPNNQFNPLAQYTRRTARYVKLPSGGQFYTKGIDLSDNGELAVYPMTAKDELLLKSPDALLNGEAVKTVLRNCVPGIVDPGEIPTIDLELILVAIRMATYGDEMELEVTHQCSPDKEHVSKANVNLGNLLDTATYYSGEPMVVRMPNALLAEIRPYTMSDRNKISMATWEQMNHMNQVDNDKTADATKKLKEASLGVGKLIAVTMDIVCNSVIKVTTPDGAEVTDPKFIKEWVTNLEKADFDIIDRGIKDLMNMGVSKEMHLKCENCGSEFTSAINFNPSDFFAQGLPS